MTHLLSLLLALTDSIPKQKRFMLQGSRYMNGAQSLCQWYVDSDTGKLYKLTLEETTIEAALPLSKFESEAKNET